MCVPVQADQPARGQPLGDRFRVPAGSQRGVYVCSFRPEAQPFQHLVQHHRRMRRTQFFCAPALPPRRILNFFASLLLFFISLLLKSPAPCHPHPCTAHSSTYPAPGCDSSLPDSSAPQRRQLPPSFARPRAAPLATAVFPAHPIPPPARNSSFSSRICASPHPHSAFAPACPRFPTKLSSDKFLPSRPSYL